MFYATYDKFSGIYPKEYTEGFANTVEAVAFATRAERDAYLQETKYLRAVSLSRQEALRYAERTQGNPGDAPGYVDKILGRVCLRASAWWIGKKEAVWEGERMQGRNMYQEQERIFPAEMALNPRAFEGDMNIQRDWAVTQAATVLDNFEVKPKIKL